MILLVANPSRKDIEGTLTVPMAGEASVWNPETGGDSNNRQGVCWARGLGPGSGPVGAVCGGGTGEPV